MRLVSSLVAACILASVAPAYANQAGPDQSEGLRLIDTVGRCVAAKYGLQAKRLLVTDRQLPEYDVELRKIAAQAQQDCVSPERDDVDVKAFNKHLFAGAIAENLLKDSVEPLQERLAAVARVEMAKSGDRDRDTDHCMVRTSPKNVAVFLATPIGEAEEAVAAETLLASFPNCAKANGFPAEVVDALQPAVSSLRAGLSISALTLLSAAETSN